MSINKYKKIFLITLAVMILLLIIVCYIDISNIDNEIHKFLNLFFDPSDKSYFDINIVPTLLSLLEITALILAVLTPFILLKEQREDLERNIKLSNSPFVVPSESINFLPYATEPTVELKNIGAGSALFTRISYEKEHPDLPGNAILKANQPHSFYIGIQNGDNKISSIQFEQSPFYNFLCGEKLSYNITPKDIIDKLKSLNEKEYYIYIHCSDIINTEFIFKVKYLLRKSQQRLFQLKRMEIELIKGQVEFETKG